MRVFDFRCPSCHFEARLQTGTPDMDQTLTDVNTEFAQYRIFACGVEKKFLSANMLDAAFKGNCPSDGSKLQEVVIGETRCPRCAGPLQVDESKPLSAGDSAAE